MKLLTKTQIESVLQRVDPVAAIEQGFVDYSKGRAQVPPVGELLMDKGEVHIKYGCIKQQAHYVVKVASGFYDNPKLGLPSSNGLMLLFCQQTGALKAVLLDEGMLTDIRTAVAGSISAKYFAPARLDAIGIVGSGIQARLQAKYIGKQLGIKHIRVWARNPDSAVAYQQAMMAEGFSVEIMDSAQHLAENTRLIVTTTPARSAILQKSWLQPGTHIIAVGSDTPDKQELDSAILAAADWVVADSISQCLERGEIHQALKQNAIRQQDIVELGNVIAEGQGRTDESQIIVTDLTGVAVQDIKIAEAVFLAA